MKSTLRHNLTRRLAGVVLGLALAAPIAGLGSAQSAHALSLKLPDLTVSSVVTGAPRAVAGGQYVVSVGVTVKNQGPVSTPLNTKFEVTASSAGTFHAMRYTNGTGVAVDGYRGVLVTSPIGAFGTRSFGAYLYFSSLPRHGTPITIKADSCDGVEFAPIYCRVMESNENNNTRTVLLP